MTPLQSWVDSLSLLRPSALKLFCLMTLRSIGQAYAVLVRASWPFYIFWWSILSFCFFSVCLDMQSVFAGLYAAFFFVSAAATRPSVARKNWWYIVYMASYRWYVLVVLVGVSFVMIGWPTVLRSLFFSILSIWTFFAFDSHKNVRGFIWSIVSAGKYALYNMPLIVITALIHTIGVKSVGFLAATFSFFGLSLSKFLIEGGAVSLVSMATLWLSTWLPIAMLSLWAVLMCNLYIKRVHEQPALYH